MIGNGHTEISQSIQVDDFAYVEDLVIVKRVQTNVEAHMKSLHQRTHPCEILGFLQGCEIEYIILLAAHRVILFFAVELCSSDLKGQLPSILSSACAIKFKP